jgi:hypothetical protein
MLKRYFPDVATAEEAEKATKGGVFAALAFAAMNVLGLVFLFATGNIPGLSPGTPSEFPFAVIGVLLELAIILTAAWRFKQHKGLIVGSLTLALFLFEVATKIATGTTNIFWIFFYLAVFAGFVNGLRAAFAYRTLDQGLI